jgi:hypothetical protein
MKKQKEQKWSSDLAYAIGLLTTDGNLSKDGRHITFRSSDIELLKNFKRCLALKTNIAKTKNDSWAQKPCYRIQFSDKRLFLRLIKIGLFPNKTYKIGKLKIPHQYFKDFLRGHLDGDGCITVYQDKWNTFKKSKYIYTRLTTRFYSASKTHIKWIRETIIKLLDIKGHLCEEKAKRSYQNTSMWVLKFGKKESLKLLRWIYYEPNILCLKRKKLKFKNFILAG